MRETDILLLHARWVLPVDPAGMVLDYHSVVIQGGRILDVLPSSVAIQRYPAVPSRSLDRHVLIPGLVNAHTHAAMTLLRGLSDDLPLMTWLTEHIWPAEARWVDPDFVRDGTALAAAEMLSSGITCFNDMYFFPEEAAEAAVTVGIRASVGLIVLDFPTAWATNADHYLTRAVEVHMRLRHVPLIRTTLAPHAPYTVSDAPLAQVQTLSERLDLPIHIHLHETATEVEQAVAAHGERPLARLARLGLLSPHLLAVHMTQLTEDEIATCAKAKIHVVHCPESNLKLASGFCPVENLQAAGINVALGTDGAASNNDLDLFSEMRTAALLAKAVSGNAAALPAHAALYLATLAGAKALGMADEIGSIVPGKAADLVAVDLSGVATEPVYHPASALVYAASRNAVTDVWVAGHQVVRDRILVTVDTNEILNRARQWGARISEKDQTPK
ncbi:5-methylthioadenosine/S-adenosylhomocysteine deaminase [Gammaproteobacteria bacterium]